MKKPRLLNRATLDEAMSTRQDIEKAMAAWDNGEDYYTSYGQPWIESQDDYTTAAAARDKINEFVGPDHWVSRLLEPEKHDDWDSFDSISSFLKTMEKSRREYPTCPYIKNVTHFEELEMAIIRAKRRKKKLAYERGYGLRLSPRPVRNVVKTSGDLKCRWCGHTNFVIEEDEAQCRACGAWMQKSDMKWVCLHDI